MSKKSVKRWSAKRKQEVVLWLLRGDSLNAQSREAGQPASVLSRWRDEFLEGGLTALKRRSGMPLAQGLELWVHYNQRLLDFHQALKFPLLSFDEEAGLFLEKISLLCEQLAVGLKPDRTIFFDTGLRHSSVADTVPAKYHRLYRALQQRAF